LGCCGTEEEEEEKEEGKNKKKKTTGMDFARGLLLFLISPLHKPLFRTFDEKFCGPYNGVNIVCFSNNSTVPVRKCVFN
jgi:hypothetical protein